MGSGGGGGSSGRVEYSEKVPQAWSRGFVGYDQGDFRYFTGLSTTMAADFAANGDVNNNYSAINLGEDIVAARSNNPFQTYDEDLETGNPNATAYDPATSVAAMQARLALVNGKIDALNARTDWGSYADDAKAKADIIYNLGDTAAKTQVTEAITEAQKVVTGSAFAAVDSSAILTAAVDDAVAKISLLLKDRPGKAEEYLRPIITKAMTETMNNLKTVTVNSATYAKDAIGPAMTDALAVGAALDNDIKNVTDKAMSLIKLLPTNALSAVMDAFADSSISEKIDARVKSFEDDARRVHLAGNGRMAAALSMGGMAMTNAYFRGMAMREDEFQKEVLKFRTQVEIGFLDKLLEGYLRSYAQQVQEQIQMKTRIVIDYLQKTTENIVSQYQIYNQMLTSQFQMQTAEIEQEYRLQGLLLFDKLKLEQLESEQNIVKSQATLQAWNSMFEGDRKARNQFVDSGIAKMLGGQSELNKINMASAHMTTEVNRIDYVANKEERDVNLEIDIREALYPVELWQYWTQYQASLPGGITNTSNKKGNAAIQSGVSGAIGGGAMAALATSNPLLIGLGAAVGGVAGAIGG